MTEEEKLSILNSAKTFFLENIIANHERNWKKLTTTSEFDYNPFLINYLAMLLGGDTSSESLAKALIYPRALGTSINTTFGTLIQRYITKFFPESFGSTTDGIDIEFIDRLDGRRKYCQLKAGPQTINDPDVKTITDHFIGLKNLARTNNVTIATTDMIVGILYGKKMSGCYKEVDREYPGLMGKDFWEHLTGDSSFYGRIVKVFADVFIQVNASEEFANVISQLASDIESNGL